MTWYFYTLTIVAVVDQINFFIWVKVQIIFA